MSHSYLWYNDYVTVYTCHNTTNVPFMKSMVTGTQCGSTYSQGTHDIVHVHGC